MHKFLGQDYWNQKYTHCGGKHQSPININEYNVEKVYLLPLRFENFDLTPKSATIINNGHTGIVIIRLQISLKLSKDYYQL